MSGLAWAAVAVFTVAYVLIATEKIHRVAAALGGAAVMLLIGATDTAARVLLRAGRHRLERHLPAARDDAHRRRAQTTGVFEYVAIWAAKRARGRPFRVMVILVLITAVASAVLDNVTTVLLIAPVTFLVCERLGVPAVPFLIAEAMASNIGGTATLVGDPPNIIIGSRGGLSYNDFLVHLAPFVVLLLRRLPRPVPGAVPGGVPLRPATRARRSMRCDEREAIRDRRLLVLGLRVLGAVTAAFVLHTTLHLEPAVVALLGGLLLLALSRLDAGEISRDVEWPTLVFFAGLFIMVGALVNTGVVEQLSAAAIDATADRLLPASMVLLWGSAALSAIVDNIPYVATMSPVVADLVHAHGGTARSHVLWWALALGADLGGNATAVGASANVVVLGLAERAGQPITSGSSPGTASSSPRPPSASPCRTCGCATSCWPDRRWNRRGPHPGRPTGRRPPAGRHAAGERPPIGVPAGSGAARRARPGPRGRRRTLARPRRRWRSAQDGDHDGQRDQVEDLVARRRCRTPGRAARRRPRRNPWARTTSRRPARAGVSPERRNDSHSATGRATTMRQDREDPAGPGDLAEEPRRDQRAEHQQRGELEQLGDQSRRSARTPSRSAARRWPR